MPVKKMKYPEGITPLDVFMCQKANVYGDCEEMAAFRITQNGISMTACAIHAKPFIAKELILEPRRCRFCEKACRPGLVFTDGNGNRFCTEAHLQNFRMRSSEVYR